MAPLYILGEQCFSIREVILSGAWDQARHNNTATLSLQAQALGFRHQKTGLSKQDLFEFKKCWLLICD